MSTQIANATLIINNEPVAYIPNSLVWNEGLGEQKMRNATYGGGENEAVYSDDAETKVGKVMFELPTTIANVIATRQWKLNRNNNVAQVLVNNADGTLTKTFSGAAILNSYDVPAGAETNIAIEFESKPAV